MVLIELIIIAYITVFIVDVSGAIDSLKSGLKWILTKGKMSGSDYILKPVDCSLCMTFWIGILYLLITSNFTIAYFGFVCLLACFANIIKNSILLLEDVLVTIINLIYKIIDRLK